MADLLEDAAFPTHPDHAKGMTTFEWFAGQALAGLCVSYGQELDVNVDPEERIDPGRFELAQEAFLIAASMVCQLSEWQAKWKAE